MRVSHFISSNRYILFVCLVILGIFSTLVSAEDFQAGPIHILAPFSRALPSTSENGAVYLTLVNHGHQPDQLIGVATPIAKHAEIHAHKLEEAMMKMQKVDSFELPPHEEVRFTPGDHHIMLIGLTQPLKQGERFPLMLHFKQAGHASVEVIIVALDTTTVHGEHDHGNSQQETHLEESQEHVGSRKKMAMVECESTDEKLVYQCVITLTDKKTKEAITDAEFSVGADMSSMPGAHNVKPVPAHHHGAGEYHARLALEMYGEWVLKLDFTKPERDRKVVKLVFGE